MKRFWLICLYILASCAWSNAQEVAEIPQHLLLSKGIEYIEQGELQKAEKCLLQAREFLNSSKVKGADELYASATYHLGIVYLRLWILEDAKKYAEEAVILYRIIHGTDNYYYVRAQNTLGGIYVGMQEYDKAEYYLNAAEQIANKLEKQTSNSASLHDIQQLQLNIQINLGALYMETDSTHAAMETFVQACKLIQVLSMEESFETLNVLHNMGVVCTHIGEYDNAEKFLLAADDLRKKLYGEAYRIDMIGTRVLSELYLNKGQFSQAIKYSALLDSINRVNYMQSLQNITSKQREEQLMYNMGADYIHVFPQIIYHSYSQDPSVTGWGYNNELFFKGLLLQSDNVIKHSIDESTDSTLIYQRNELTALRQNILSLQEKDPYSTLIPQYEQRAEDLEKQIIVNSAAYRENMQQWSITWDSVRKALKPQQVAIEYMQVPIWEDDMYCTLLLRDTCSMPILIPLSKQSEIDSLLPSSTSDSTEIHRTYAYNERGKALSTYVWKGLQYYIHPGDTIFFSPTGILHQIAIENLPYDSSRTMGDVYHLVRLSSTRELVKNRAAIAYKRAVLYGGIDYNTTPEDLGALAVRNIRHSYAYSLPGTEKEVQAISDILTSAQIQTTCNHKNIATEESFKALSGSQPHIIHLATHGFYWQDSTAQQEVYFAQRGITKADNKYAIDPLERCGLLFAGANTALSGHTHRLPQNVEDGVLTAKEISLMDLRGTDLVVLSACETGLGDVTGEGVFGLQRAFKMAGVQTIIMSLWPVNDDATRLLMTEFYHNRITLHQTKQDAFRNAQNSVRTQYPSFYYWAGFILLD